MKLTKEELIKKVATLEAAVTNFADSDETRRVALSKMLSAPLSEVKYAYEDRKRTIYFWPEIYFEVGKLVAGRTFYDFEGNVLELETLTSEMKMNWEQYFREKRDKQP